MYTILILFGLIFFTNCYFIKKTYNHITFKGITFVGDKYCPNITYGDELAKLSLDRLKSTGATWVSIVVTEYQDYANSTEIYPIYNESVFNDYYIYKTEKIEDIKEIIEYAHDIGLNVLLKPHIDISKISDTWVTWRGNIAENFTKQEEWDAWFSSYKKFIVKYAKLAEATYVDMLSISTELIATSKMDVYWRDIIRAVKKEYTGLLTDSANWGGEEFNKTWWDELDYIGIDAYYAPLKVDKLIDFEKDLEEYFDEILDKLRDLSEKFNRDIIITEIGFCSGNCDRNETATLDDQYIQAHFYETFYKKFAARKFIKGFFWWAWNTDPYFGGMEDSCISPQYKLGQYILTKYYGGNTRQISYKPEEKATCKCTI